MRIVFVSDFFVEHILGGGELNNEELISLLIEKGYQVNKIQSHLVTLSWLQKHKKLFFVVSNFVNLNFECRAFLCQSLKYVIYEHDHKYLANRNPALYKNFLAPKTEIIFKKFYESAQSILCQSKMHKDILVKNLNLENIISVGGNLWSEETLEHIRGISKFAKGKKYSIMDSTIPHKNTFDAVRYCRVKNIPYELIPSCQHKEFLEKISQNDTLIFLPQTPETLSRIIVEARMLGCKIITNNLVGATSENWFSLKGEKLISIMYEKRDIIPKIVVGSFSDENTSHNQ